MSKRGLKKSKKSTKFKISDVKYVVGIDEAGRGPLAGPLAFGFVMFEVKNYDSYCKHEHSLPRGIDSKKLSESRREFFFNQLKKMKRDGSVFYTVVLVSPADIDNKGLSLVIKSAVKAGLSRLKVDSKNSLILLDGGLKAPSEYTQETIIKGDEKERVIALASIAAKVTRDNEMRRLSKIYPDYNFDKHKGYGTILHRKKLAEMGLTPIHRRSFCTRVMKMVLTK